MTKTGSGSSRTVGVTDTSAADVFEVNTFASIDDVKGSKTVLLTRTGNYVGTYARGGSASGTNTYNFGKLPTIKGNNYGPKACPSATTLVSAETSTKEELRMCGATGKWVYFGAANLLMDKGMYAKYSADSATGVASSTSNINSVDFLSGESSYKSGDAMDDSRAVYLHDGGSSADVLMTSETITPAMSSGMADQDTAGQWRFYTVVFYCDMYDRTDLTACPAENRKMFYVADPNPSPAFGTTAGAIGGGGSGDSGDTGTGVSGTGAGSISCNVGTTYSYSGCGTSAAAANTITETNCGSSFDACVTVQGSLTASGCTTTTLTGACASDTWDCDYYKQSWTAYEDATCERCTENNCNRKETGTAAQDVDSATGGYPMVLMTSIACLLGIAWQA